jgi:short-subunit dehydrogenase
LAEWRETRENMINTHVLATSKLTYYVAKQMKKNEIGNIINISSLVVFFPTLYGFMYHATKSFVKLFTQNLFIYFKNTNIKVQCLCPWFTETSFFDRDNASKNKKPDRKLFQSVDEVVISSLRNLRKDKYLYIPGFKNKLFYLLSKITPLKLVNFIVSSNKKKQ